MKILKEYKGYQILERYGKPYVRFWGGRDDDMPCEFPVSDEDADRTISDAIIIEELIAKAKSEIEWTAASFYKIGITEYLLHYSKLSPARASKNYEKISRHPDVRNEFYHYVMEEKFSTNPLQVEGFTAEHLANNYPFSPLGAYNYLIYLREMPEKALADLKAGLPSRESTYREVGNQQKEEKSSWG